MGRPLKSVTIVGGGTAGWLTAMLLQSHCMKQGKSRAGLDRITLIESPNIPTVGVGEATVPGMPRTLRECGLSERQFFRDCNASFKLGVQFGNWNVDRAGEPVSYINPFARPPILDGVEAGIYFNEFGAEGLEFAQTYTPALDLARAFKGPRTSGAREFDPNASIPYAYHLDAGRFANLMRDVCIERGVTHVSDDVIDVKLDNRGHVEALKLERTGRMPVELVIDCTGFRGLIINQVLKEPFVSYSKYLANDKALAVQIPHPDPERIEPMTRATALGAGWSWRVPLFNRIGTGYVFSSAHRTDEQARDEFLAHLGADGKGAEPRVIPIRIGRNRNAWVGNCVAVGLSGGFIEPLESTAIHMIDASVRWLIEYLPDSDFAPPLRNRFNKVVDMLYDEVRDFICLHFALNNRADDPYWIDARTQLAVPDSLAENLDLWKHMLPAFNDLRFTSIFGPSTYQAVLFGKRVYENGWGNPKVNRGYALKKDSWISYLRSIRGKVDAQVAASSDHYALLLELRKESATVPFAVQRPAPFGLAAPTVGVPVGKAVLPKFPLAPKPAPKAPSRPRRTKAEADGDGSANLL